MPLYLGVSHSTAATLFATLERLSDGFFWNNVTALWEVNPSTANRKVSLPEGTGINVGSYIASVLGLGNVGYTRVRVHDDIDAADKVIAGGQTYVWGGNEINGAELVAILLKTNLIGGVKTFITSPVAVSGDITIYQGDAYAISKGRALEWNDPNSTWPDLDDATITLEVNDGQMVVTGTVVSTTQVRAELAGSDTNLLEEGEYPYRVVATFNDTGTGEDERVTLSDGLCVVLDREDQ